MSDSNTKDDHSIHYTDNRRVLGENSISAQDSNVSVQYLDGGAIGRSFDLGENALDGMRRVSSDSMLYNSRALDSSLNFADSTVGRALDSNAFAMQLSANAQSDALSFADAASARSSRSMSEAMDYSAGAFGAALSSNAQATSRALNTASDAFGEALSYSSRSNTSALNLGADAMTAALAYGGKQTGVALDSLNQSAGLVKDAYADAKGRGAITDQILMVAIAMAGLVAFTAIRK